MNIPVEIVRHIISYVDNIDIRRSFGQYSKIDVSKHRDIPFGYKQIRPYNRDPCPWLNTEYDEDGNPPQHISTQWSFNSDIYVYLHNLFDSEERQQNKIKNDFYEILLSEIQVGSVSYMKYYGTIHRYLPIDYFENGEPRFQRFAWKQIYVQYQRPCS